MGIFLMGEPQSDGIAPGDRPQRVDLRAQRIPETPVTAADATPTGLTSSEARRRLLASGPNIVKEQRRHPAWELLRRLWGPVPWM
ncbi:MAG TPA: cation-transporting P-type ATPase, partial [Burkholderiaceae bacterium]|nr:cation-transporting P-type ATPase [Burkholderiaceae bacterium]